MTGLIVLAVAAVGAFLVLAGSLAADFTRHPVQTIVTVVLFTAGTVAAWLYERRHR